MFDGKYMSLAPLGAGLTHAWQWCVFYSLLVIPFASMSQTEMLVIVLSWPVVQALSYAVVFLLNSSFSNESVCIRITRVLCFFGSLGTILCVVSSVQTLFSSFVVSLVGIALIGISVTALRLSWMQFYTNLNHRKVQFASSLFIAFGSATFLLCNFLPWYISLAAVCLMPFVSFILLTQCRKQILPAISDEKDFAAESVSLQTVPLALICCLLVFGVANSYIRGLGFSVYGSDSGVGATLLFSSIVILGIVLAFSKSSKYLYIGATLAVVGGLMFLIFPVTYGVGTLFIGVGFICVEVIVWMVIAEHSKANKSYFARIAASAWFVIYLGSSIGMIVGRWVSFEAPGGTLRIATSLVLVYLFVALLAVSLNRNFLDIFNPAPERFQPVENRQMKCIAASMQFDLTRRESEVLEYLIRGESSYAIERELVISKNTVKYHIRNIYRKIGANSKEELIALVLGCDVPFFEKEPDEIAGRR